MSNCAPTSVTIIKKIILLLPLFIFPFSFDAKGQNLPQQFNKVVGRSNFIFLGTISYLDSSNIAVKLQKRNKAIVKVDEVIDATETLLNMKGKEITVVFSPGSSPPKTNKKVFYTFIWYYGTTLGVKEIKNNFGQNFNPQLASQIQQSRTKIFDDSLSAELRRAKIVVVATVKSISAEMPVRGLEESEHDPKFRQVTFDVKEVLKGKAKKDSLSAYYASSYDVMWINSPKLSEATEGIFLLHDQQLPGFLPLKGYTVLDPRDFQTVSELNKIRELLRPFQIK